MPQKNTETSNSETDAPDISASLPPALRQVFIYVFLLLDLILPIAAAVYLHIFADTSVLSPTLLKFERFFFYYLSLPIYTIYAFQFVKASFPDSYRDVFIMFAPLVFSLVTTRIFWPDESYLDIFIYESIPFYLGLHLVLGGGLIMLIFLGSKEMKPLQMLYQIPILLCIMAFFAGPATFVGYLAIPDSFAEEYYASIVISALCHLPLLKMLHRKKEL